MTYIDSLTTRTFVAGSQGSGKSAKIMNRSTIPRPLPLIKDAEDMERREGEKARKFEDMEALLGNLEW